MVAFNGKKNIKTSGNAGLVDKYFPMGPFHTVNKLHILLLFLCILLFFFFKLFVALGFWTVFGGGILRVVF